MRKKWREIFFLCMILMLSFIGCASKEREEEDALMMRAENAKDMDTPVMALVLTSEDGEENEEIIESFRRKAQEIGAELLVRIPEVTEEEAKEARALKGEFVLCEVDPIEYQMLFINELVAEDVDVIAIHANHGEALEPVLTAARNVGIRICAFEQEVSEESRDVYTTALDAPEAAANLLY